MFKKHPRVALLLLTLALLAGVGVWWGLSHGEEPLPESATSTTGSTAPTAAPVPAAAPRAAAPKDTRAWVEGTLYRYSVTSSQSVTFAQGQPGAQGQPSPQAPPRMSFLIQGEWLVGVASVHPERIEARVQLRPSSFSMTMDGQPALPPEAQQMMTQVLSMPFFVTYLPTGAAQTVHFERGVDVLAHGLLRSLVASTQVVFQGKPQDTWQSEEYDTTGQYSAAYRRVQGRQFEKSKQAYMRVATEQGLMPASSEVRVDARSRTSFDLAAEDLWTQSLQGDEDLEVDSGAALPKATHELKVTLKLLERTQDASLVGALAARRLQLASMPLASYQAQVQDPNDHYRQVLAGKSFDELVQSLRSLPKDTTASENARTEALERLRALFMLQPAEALKVPGVLRSLDPLAASPMLGALSAASTPEAIRSLTQALEDRGLSHPVRTDAAAALGMANSPTREGVDALRRLSRDSNEELRDTALLGLGNAAMQMRDEDARGADSLINELKSAYRSAATPEQKALVLRALGNTNSPEVFSVVQDALRSPSPLVREAALVALRNVQDPAAERLLVSHLLGDPSSDVRRGAVLACSFRPLTSLLPALDQALRSDRAEAVRLDIIQLLGSQRISFPAAIPLLIWASQNDPSPTLRQAAQSLLNPAPPRQP